MGQNCSCFFKPIESKTENLGSRPVISITNNGDGIMDNNKETSSHENKIKSNISNNPEKVGTQLNKYIRGYLFRKKYHSIYKQELKNFSEDIYITFVNTIAKNEQVIESENKYASFYNIDGWKTYYDTKPYEEDTKNNSRSFNDKIIITYTTQPKSCYNTKDEIFMNISSLFKGTVDINNTKHGIGTAIYRDGSKFHGNWIHNRFIGWNMSISSKGIMFIGNFVDYSITGKGERYTLENHIYKGDLVSNLREGHGIETTDKSIYDGEFKEDKQNGKAKVTFISGDTYEGDIVNGQFHGKGHYKWKNKNQEYIGDYKNGKLHGEGLFKIKENEYYKGHYVEGVKEGEGEMKFSNGKLFVGPFSKGKPHGIGYYENGKDFKGEVEFIYGQLNKKHKPSKSPVRKK